MASDLSSPDITTLVSQKTLVYDGQSNLPASYSGSSYKLKNDVDYAPTGDLVVFSGSVDDLRRSTTARVEFAKRVQEVYSGTTISSVTKNIGRIKATTIDTSTPSNEAKALANETVIYGLGLDLVADSTSAAVNGVCGSSDGQSLASAPTANLCTTGTTSSVS